VEIDISYAILKGQQKQRPKVEQRKDYKVKPGPTQECTFVTRFPSVHEAVYRPTSPSPGFRGYCMLNTKIEPGLSIPVHSPGPASVFIALETGKRCLITDSTELNPITNSRRPTSPAPPGSTSR